MERRLSPKQLGKFILLRAQRTEEDAYSSLTLADVAELRARRLAPGVRRTDAALQDDDGKHRATDVVGVTVHKARRVPDARVGL